MFDSLPQEITHDILFRLPIKSLIQCTSVCKPWRSMIINQSFIQSHLRRKISFHKRNDIHLFLVHSVSGHLITSVRTHRHRTVVSKIRQEVFSVHYDNQDFDKNFEIEFPSALKKKLKNEILRVIGICNGLVCFADDMACYGNSFIIWNPFIRKSVTLPNPGITFPMYNSIPNYGGFDAAIGFGYDAMTSDYKVVRVATPKNKLQGPTMAEVYSLATGSWRSLGSVAPQCAIYGREKQLFFNGALHWPAVSRERDDHFILTFDLGNELFYKMSMPSSVIWSYILGLLLSVSGDKKFVTLFVMNADSKDSYLEIWVMKEYGVKESWTKLINLGPQGPERLFPRALCFRRNGEVLVMLLKGGRQLGFETNISKHELVSLDLVSKQMESLEICGPYCSVDSYEESLLLLDKTDAVSL
ncbi:F-box/kelch-repeat protein At3g23880-like [Pyrus x bretschneideri]|uniref:F-box/kelch-repeat protein At3g23880-like n=1 Tax=Pyrus x bretschneideri TaxID=225117 RepID=UPI0020308D51|nr:F-box/kelch-repeat protein At3g23880-like [Pyrus x bretschneideri]